METKEIDRRALERLATLQPLGGAVLSLYLNLEPADVPTPHARHIELDSLVSEAERIQREAGLTSEQEAGFHSDLQRVRGLLDNGLAGGGARAVAIFAAHEAALFEAYRLPHSVEPQVYVDATPFVEPLLSVISPREWAVLLTSRRAARILRGSRDELTEVARLDDDVHRRHSQGGWSQSRYERGIDKEIHDHVVRACEALFAHHSRMPLDHLIVGGPHEIWPEVSTALHPYLRERLAGQIDVDVERATAQEVLARSKDLMRETARRAEQSDLDRLDEGVGAGGRAAAGLDDVLGELAERRIEKLLIEDGFRTPGAACTICGRLAASVGPCPIDGSSMEPRADIVEDAISAAVAQGAGVAAVQDRARIGAHDSIGALLRY